jgi:ABC-type sugar transport system substrate-binding protein
MDEQSEASRGAREGAFLPGEGKRINRRRFVKVGAGFMSVGIAGGVLSACGDSDSRSGSTQSGGGGKQVTFGFSQPYAEIPVVASVKRMVKASAQGEGWKVLLDETQAGDLQDQQSVLDTWITQKVTGVCVFPTEPSAFEAIARRAEDAGVIWTTYAQPMDRGAGGVLFPPELSGEVTGRATVEWINANDPDAEVLILETPLSGAFKTRTDIPRRMIEQQTRAKVVAVQVGVEQSKGLQVTEDVLQAHPNVTVVVSMNDDGALGAAEAFRKAGRQDPSRVWIIGQDGSEDGLAAIKKGDTFFRATAALDLPRLSEEVVAVTKRAIDKGWKPGDEQEYSKLAPTMVKVGDTELIDRFMAAYR